MAKLKLGISALILASGLSACFFDSEETVNNAVVSKDGCGSMLFAVGNNYKEKTGRLYASSLDSSCKWDISIYNDSRVESYGDYAYLLEGFGSDKITQVEAKTGKVMYQLPLATGSNPHSIGFVNDSTALVPSFGGPNLYKINTKSGKVVDSLDLSALAASGTKSPAGEDILIKNGKAYVILQRMDAKWKSANQVLIQVDPSSMKITDSVHLKTNNTFQLMEKGDQILAISKGNTDYDANWNETSRKDGGLELINFSAKTSEILIDESSLGGKPVHGAFASDGKLYVGVYKKFGSIPMALVDLSSKKVDTTDLIKNAWGSFVYDSKSSQLLVSDDDGAKTGIYAVKNWSKTGTYFADMIAPYSLSLRP